MAESAAAIVGGAAPAELQIITMIGRGSFASVYRAIWRGRCVALKVVQLPAVAGGESVNDELSSALQTRERMAVMEAVVSVTMSHPNVVQVGLVCTSGPECRRVNGCRRLRFVFLQQLHMPLCVCVCVSMVLCVPSSCAALSLWLLLLMQVYTFALQPLFQGGATVTQQDAVSTPSSSSQQPAGWELQLIMEYCEEVGAFAA
jgi:serine/threonine protein kinase